MTLSMNQDDNRLAKLAEQFNLHIRRDACGDRIIQGRRGHLYFAGGELCLMVIDGRVAHRSRWQALGGKLWMGDISDGFQDVKITGIPMENAQQAIRMCRIKAKRRLSPEERERRANGARKLRLKSAA